MPKGSAWINFIYINVGFILQIFAMYYFTKIKEIKDNWPKYRCNPMYMPLSDDISSDFAFCVQGMQTNFMGYLLQPVNYILSGLTSITGNFAGDIGNIRGMFSYIRDQITAIVGGIFGVFSNIVIEFQRITLSIKDIVGKIIGMVVTIMYIVDGSMKTVRSMWSGPPGILVRAVCFLPTTKLKLQDGTIKKMKDLSLGDVLENGSKVQSVMKISNYANESYYKIPKKGVNGATIYVTGSHLVQDAEGKFIQVKNHPDSKPAPNKKISWFSCLITDDHKIQIGDVLFWDWEDDEHYKNKFT
jgi:hypothetical protein